MLSRVLVPVLLAGCLSLVGCGGGSSGGNNAGQSVNFDQFAKSVLTDNEMAEPRDVDNVNFEFNDDPGAFDDIVD